MSGLEGSINSLERQLKGLQMQRSPAQTKKIPPPPPPKKNRAQPQAPSYATHQTLPYEQTYSANNSAVYNQEPPLPPPPPQHIYSNVSHLPPPPPPQSTYFNNYEDSGHPDHLLPPPSPVSSNYSELARATRPYPSVPQYPHYQNLSDYGSHTSPYESIYEPIELSAPTPTVPHAAHASRDGYQANDKNVSLTSRESRSPYRNGAGDRRPLAKEEEVDVLTQLLVQSISDGSEPDTYGVCVRCHCKVKGEDSGCTAMEQIYHVSCFTCARCNASLQGKPFYAVDNQPYCEHDYLLTLERCSVCNEPIRDRILRATGKPYHPACFVCVACGKSLDGIPFTVDAANQIHCIEDFHAKFAPRCCVCALPIMPEDGQEETVRVVALDRSFHVKCYRCEDCGLLLSSENEGRGCYPLDDHILCKSCNAERIRNLTNVITTDL